MQDLFPKQTPELIRDQTGQRNLMKRFLSLLQHSTNDLSIVNKIGRQQLYSAIETIQKQIDLLE